MRVIITGASRGIGLGIAEVLCEAGHSVGLIARSADSLAEVAARLTAGAAGRVAHRAADVRDEQATRQAIEGLIKEMSGVDALVNNAGLVIRKNAIDLSSHDMRAMVETNILGVLHAARAVLPALIAQHSGHIVNISSISGYVPLPGGSVYAATKHAVTGFSDSLLQEVRDHGIRVTTVFPGSVDSESHRHHPTANHLDSDHRWKLTPRQVGQTILHVLETDPNHLVSRVEVRPLTRPPK